MGTKYTAPMPVPAGADTRHPRITRWWAALAPAPEGEAVLCGSRGQFTVSAPGGGAWSSQQLVGEVAIHIGSALTVCAVVTDGPIADRLRPARGLLSRRRRASVLAGVSIPVAAVSRLHAEILHHTHSTDPDERALIARRRYGNPTTWTVTAAFTVDGQHCELVVDGRADDTTEQAVLVLADAVAGPGVGFTDRPASSPAPWLRTIDVRAAAPAEVHLP